MFLHYLRKLNSSNLLQITIEKIRKRVVFDKNETYMLSYGWLEIVVLFLQHMLQVTAVRLHACTKTLAPHANCIVNDALPDVTPHLLHTLFQFVSVVHPRLVHLLLDDAPDSLINRVKVSAVCWPNIRQQQRRSRAVSRAGVLGRCALKRRKIPLIPRASQVVASLTGAHRGSKRRWS